jgi:hypothetical protein
MTSSHTVEGAARTGTTNAPAFPIPAAPRRTARPLDRRPRAGEIRRDRRAEDGRPRTAPTPTDPAILATT